MLISYSRSFAIPCCDKERCLVAGYFGLPATWRREFQAGLCVERARDGLFSLSVTCCGNCRRDPEEVGRSRTLNSGLWKLETPIYFVLFPFFLLYVRLDWDAFALLRRDIWRYETPPFLLFFYVFSPVTTSQAIPFLDLLDLASRV